ncbi:M24 family metallopeptidase [Hoeflea poritis]|uniref:Xaa-Pro peptidase family protein n=1 Tax=Hoeflea poritis TaxID=2993659 RepID=A0ABT4VRA7_9HYPH|nr:Xaa-Pro peptidase family protein [Hoeflea poritis]MDA4847247.1 Xaa-Pro peptidase family protein [Hoeflea poritis]
MKIEETFAAPTIDEMRGRVSRLQDALGRYGLEAYVCHSPANVLWLTNFANFVHERPFILIVPKTGRPVFLVPFLELDHATHRIVGDVELATYAEFPAPEGQRWSDRFHDVLPETGRIGVEDMLPGALLRCIGDRGLPIDLVDRLREVKSDYELGRIAYGCRLMSEAHAQLLAEARPGLSQSEINLTIGKELLSKIAADNPSMNPLATSIMTLIQNAGVSHDPHNFTDLDMKMLPGGPHVTVFNSVLNGYGAEIERTFFLGAVPEEARAPYETMMEARNICFERTRAGNLMGDIDREVNALIDKRGYSSARRHRAGHGMGVTSHEGPFLADGDEGVIKEGMVFTLEPGIYIPGVGGFRHSDTVVVADGGLACLTEAPDTLAELTI